MTRRCPCGAEHELTDVWIDLCSPIMYMTTSGWRPPRGCFIDVCPACGRDVNGFGMAAPAPQTRQTWLEEGKDA